VSGVVEALYWRDGRRDCQQHAETEHAKEVHCVKKRKTGQQLSIETEMRITISIYSS
jgi:hypothetical protein